MTIESPLLASIGGYVNGRWVQADSGQTRPAVNPATGQHLADVPYMGGAETLAAVEAARAAMDAPCPPERRKGWLLAAADLLGLHKDALARIITAEHGKPLAEAAVEVDYSAGFFRFFAQSLPHVSPEALPAPIRGCRWTIHHRPAGVAGLITPWNFPLAMLAKKFGAALAAGCAVVAKPASLTPLSAVAFWHLLDRIPLPPGMANLVVGRASEIGRTLCSHPAVRVISLTGSTEVGVRLAEGCAPHVKRLAMELGGNAPFVVLADADVDLAAEQLMCNKFRASGQTCVCANRVYVHRDVAKAFVSAVVGRVAKLRVGDGAEAGTDIGPLVSREQFDKVAGHVRDALGRGARCLHGGVPEIGQRTWGCFFPPTVLTGVTRDMLVSREETFGPVIAVAEFGPEQDVADLANDTQYGLAAYLFTRDAGRADAIICRLRFGHVGLNTGAGPTPEAPFGGMKHSGFGREGGVEGILEFCESQTVVTK